MKFFLDTAMIDEIKAANEWGILDGVTTNPSLVYKSGRPFKDVLLDICKIVDGPISAEVTTLTAPEMVKQGTELAKIHKNIVVKLPTTVEGVKACKQLSEKGIKINSTLIFSASQALVMAKAGASYVSPFIGRLDDVSEDGMVLIDDIRDIFDNYEIKTEILAASIRHPMHVVECAKAGADIATMPYSVFQQLIKHPLTDVGLKKFMEDWEKAKH
ncbi:fructose-6-phosphate aldolase [Candidatus Micrarchaeota archaeon]|nr:fructose-6-phosphate aldolase [Candidatus Micrarchaeota archaeon]